MTKAKIFPSMKSNGTQAGFKTQNKKRQMTFKSACTACLPVMIFSRDDHAYIMNTLTYEIAYLMTTDLDYYRCPPATSLNRHVPGALILSEQYLSQPS